jgi:PEP-CTERM/exosortase A-associated glycosyltransferase
MRVLHLFDHSLPVHSGYSIRSLNIILQQRRLGWTTFQLTGPKQDSPHDNSEVVEGLEFFRTSSAAPRWATRAPLDVMWTVRMLRSRLGAIIAQVDPDVIHAHSPCIDGLAALWQGRPVVYEMRTLWEEGSVLAGRFVQGGLAYRAARYLETIVLRRADVVTTISEGLRADVVARGVAPDRITVVPNAVDVDELTGRRNSDGLAARTRFALKCRYVLGYVGSLFAWEGLELLIEALVQVHQHVPDVMLLIVGAGPHEKAIKKSVAQHGLVDRVIFAGQLVHEAAVDAYAAIDLLVYPRLPMRLTELVTPLKPLEAMALGRVCIASDVGGHRELIEDRHTGLLFKAGDVSALSALIILAIRNPELCRAIAENGPRAIRRSRTWAQMVPRYEDAYTKAVDSFASRR